ncbi:MAG: serpin family protein [Candidatus Omnitrophica bacterium]|nr:serpin family protein [Candidatus Omnitrophota bacterium]
MLSFALGSSPDARAAQTQSLAESNTTFALELYDQLKASPGNLFFSPYSISTCLAMAYAGARGDTEQQMSQVLHFANDQQTLHSSFAELQRQLGQAGKSKEIELSIANALWAQKGHPFLPAFLEIAKAEYQANINQADFTTQAETVRDDINRWVAQKTKERIQDILPSGSLSALSRMVLVNAIYFKGAWAKPYKRTETSTHPFHLSATREVQVPLMHHFDEVRYMEDNDLQAVELPYESRELSMVILLPRQLDAFGALESRLTPNLLARSIGQMRRQKVEIFLPRFQLESSFNLSDALAKMGMPDAFGPKADFSGMDGTRQLYISGVFHKAWGEVNEEGTEATAATAVAMVGSAMVKPPPPPPIFRADHPFFFFIRDTHSGSLLFLGRLTNPAH